MTLGSAFPAQATLFRVDGVFEDGATLEGEFEFDAHSEMIVDWSISVGEGGAYSARAWTPENSESDYGSVQDFGVLNTQLWFYEIPLGSNGGPRRQLQLFLGEPLTGSQALIVGPSIVIFPSHESLPCSASVCTVLTPNRYLASGQVVPEPPVSCLAVVVGIIARRTRRRTGRLPRH